MARAVTQGGRTTIVGPGEHVAGAFDVGVPLDDSPEALAAVQADDRVLLDGWLRTLARHEGPIAVALAAGDQASADRLWADVERSAHAQVMLQTLDGGIDDVLRAAGVTPTERTRATLRRLLSGGRDERSVRRWRSGEQLVPEGAADFLGRIRGVTVVPSEEPDDPDGRRLRLELVLDPVDGEP